MNSSTVYSPPSIRVTRRQLELLVADIQPLQRRAFTTNWFYKAQPSDFDADFFGRCHICLQRLCKRLDGLTARLQARYRLPLNVFEAILCITALRAALRTRGHSSPASRIPSTPLARARRLELLHQLENYERRLRRRFEHEVGNSEASAQSLHRFAQYRKMVVRELFRPLPLVPTGVAILKRQLFQDLVAIAEEGLKEIGSEIPAKQIRKLVSEWFRDVRRGRVDLGLPDLMEDPSLVKARLVPFIQRRWGRMRPTTGKKRDLSIVQSEQSERLRKYDDEVD